jgi:protein-S-isoprenylcysteine O-methyltransferase Ste14
MSDQPGSSPAGQGVEAPTPAVGPRVADAVADLVQMSVDYVRQETGDVVHDKVVVPTQKAGQFVAFALGAASVLVLGICFIAVGALMLLASFIGWVGALLAVGGLMVLIAAFLTYLKTRSMQP